MQLASAGFSRSSKDLAALVNTLQLTPNGVSYSLESTNASIAKPRRVLSQSDVEEIIKAPTLAGGESLENLIVRGLVELCKSKPVGPDAITFLGEWLLANNPNKPLVSMADED